ncbi:hypothetical protein INT43_000037 [Umbelopsis isabellina]|uniref:U6 snRNA-associated Sm-like protein LSm1 n=1 Tax=Mortierella isabellina TaxID=91625 RepID=A0A8H7PFF3_MORIS|nr:hypothetical protein INT43_000037 [Umbelopsis isabellina]
MLDLCNLPLFNHPIPCLPLEKLLVILRDGRKLIGILRSFDQFGKNKHFYADICYNDIKYLRLYSTIANLVLQDTIERIHVGNCYGDIPRGIFLIRGENVVLLGEIDLEREEYSALQQVPVEEILVAQREEQEMKQKREKMKNKVLNDRGFSVDYMENDLY